MSEHITEHASQEIPFGYCHCGCGQKTSIAKQRDKSKGLTKGQPRQFVIGHKPPKRELHFPPNPSGLCMCGCGQLTPLARYTNYKRGTFKGQPVRYINGHHNQLAMYPTRHERFWLKVDRSDTNGCWEWTGTKRGYGYGAFAYQGVTVVASRFSYELHYGPIPDGMLVLHRCDNPACVNPSHLFLGTNKDNTRDMIDKGRQGFGGNRTKTLSLDTSE